MRYIIASVLATATLAIPAVASADTLTFAAVDRILTGGSASSALTLNVTGRLDGEDAVRTVALQAYTESVHDVCNRQAILAMSKPGRWHFVAVVSAQDGNHYRVSQCGLTRID
jgi:hypothetical protein